MKDSSFVLLNTHVEVGLQVSRDQEDNNETKWLSTDEDERAPHIYKSY